MARVIIFGLRDFASARAPSPLSTTATTRSPPSPSRATTCPANGPSKASRWCLSRSWSDSTPRRIRLCAHVGQGDEPGPEAIYREGKERGYSFISYVSSRATRFAGTPIGENCFILEDNTIQPFVDESATMRSSGAAIISATTVPSATT